MCVYMLVCTEHEPLPCPIVCQNITWHLFPEYAVHEHNSQVNNPLTVHPTASYSSFVLVNDMMHLLLCRSDF